MSMNYWTTKKRHTRHIGHITVNAVRTSNLATGKGKHYILKAKKKKTQLFRKLVNSCNQFLDFWVARECET
jgi:hypothetical protein